MKKLKDIYKHISKTAFWVTLSISVILLTISFILPPAGAIDPSVVGAVGELFGFGALATVIDGMHKGTDVSVSKGDTSITINNPEKNEESYDVTEG